MQRRDWERLDRVLRPSFKEELSGAFRFLFEDHMPLTVMVAALTFPLVVGLGGHLTQGTNEMLLPVIALVPILSVVVLVCALSRKIMIDAAAGLDDPPAIPELGALIHHAIRFLVDTAVMVAVFFGPAVACHLHGSPREVTIAMLVIGIILLPMALVLRQVRNDWQALWPPTLLEAIFNGGIPYLGALIVGALLFVPAAAVGIATMGSELYLQVSFAGPLVAMPLFIASRFTGRVLSNRSVWLKQILVDQTAPHPAPAPAATTPPSSARYRAATTSMSTSAPGLRRRSMATPKTPVRRQRARLDAPQHPEMSGTLRVRNPHKDKNPPPPPPARDESCRLFFKVCLDGDEVFAGDKTPDLVNRPGFRTFRGKDRVAAGAAVRTKSDNDNPTEKEKDR